MSKKFSGWVCLVAIVLYTFESSLLHTWAQAPEGQSGRIAATGSVTEPIEPEAPPKEESSLWKWVGGAVVVVVAAAAAFFAAEEANSDEADAAEASAASAAAAVEEAEAAGAAAAETTSAAAETAAMAAETAAAAAEAAANPAGFEFRMLITGTFTGSMRSEDCGNFTPSITFTLSPAAGLPGGISGYDLSSDCGVTDNLGGSYEQIDDRSVLLRLDDGFYLGRADRLAQNKLKLSNGVVLSAQSGATIRLEPVPVQ